MKTVNILVIGCEDAGSRLANELDECGYSVSVLDSDPETQHNLHSGFKGMFLAGDSSDKNVLSDAGAENADVAVVLTKNDNFNLMVAQLLKVTFEIERVFARVYDTTKAKAFKNFGIEVVCPTVYEKNQLFSMITSDLPNSDSIIIDGVSVRFVAQKPLKKQIGTLCKDVPTELTEMIFALKKKDGAIELFYNEQIIEEGDLIIRAISD